MKTSIRTISLLVLLAVGLISQLFSQVPDLIKDGAIAALKADPNRKPVYGETYNLGATGMRGWIYNWEASNHERAQGRTTQVSRQILVTHVGAASPADGVVKVDDVILGVDGKPFSDDARKSIARAIQEAETKARDGVLKLSIATFGDEVLCLPEVHSSDNGALMWSIDSAHLPALGSKIILRLRPQASPAEKGEK